MKTQILIAGLVVLSQGAFAAGEMKGTWTPIKSECSSGAPYNDGNSSEAHAAVKKQALEITNDRLRVMVASVECSSTIGFAYTGDGSTIQVGKVIEKSSTCPDDSEISVDDDEPVAAKLEVVGDSLKIMQIDPVTKAGDSCPIGDVSTTYFVRVN